GTASNGHTKPEYCEDYRRIVVHLNDGTRVIECSDHIQWIMQTNRPNDTKRPWRNKLFFRSKEGLLFYAPKPTAPELLALPDWFSSSNSTDVPICISGGNFQKENSI